MSARPLCTIREFRTRNFRVIVDALPEDSPVDVDDDGETAAKVDSGEWMHFVARARVLYDGNEIGSDYLGGCIYADPSDFQDHRDVAFHNRQLAAQGIDARFGSYFTQLVREAIAEARTTLEGLKGIHVRR